MTQNGLDELRLRLRDFAAERDWEQFHTPKNLAMALAGEVGELLEIFQWLTPEQAAAVMSSGRANDVRDELADVAIYLVRLADILDVDLLEVAHAKLDRNHHRFPADEVHGRADVPAAAIRTVERTETGDPKERSATHVELQPITDQNVKAVCDLTVAPNQEHLVATNVRSLAQAYADYEHAWPRAIVLDGEVVGFVMLEINPEDEHGRPFWLWRLMVGADHQRQGIATAALAQVFDEVRSRGGVELYTSWVPGDGSPEPFYLGLGFEPNGEVDDGEIVARLSLADARV